MQGLADRIIALQPAARDKVPAALQDKLRVIVQSAEAPASNRAPDTFDVCVVGGLRPVKDPMRTAAALTSLRALSGTPRATIPARIHRFHQP